MASWTNEYGEVYWQVGSLATVYDGKNHTLYINSKPEKRVGKKENQISRSNVGNRVGG